MDAMGSAEPRQSLDRDRYELEREDDFSSPQLDRSLWLPWYLPQWSSREASAARYTVGDGTLRLLIEADQPPWCPEFDGWIRVSSLQTGVFAGPVGSSIGQHRFRNGLIVREEQANTALYAPMYGLFELRARALDHPNNMVALWMIGYEDEPERSAEICIFEIFGRDVAPDSVKVGMGVHPFGDPTISDEFSTESVAINAREVHSYAVEWTPGYVASYVDGNLVKVVHQSPAYRMQFMLTVYEFAEGPVLSSSPDRYPKAFEVASFRGYRRR